MLYSSALPGPPQVNGVMTSVHFDEHIDVGRTETEGSVLPQRHTGVSAVKHGRGAEAWTHFLHREQLRANSLGPGTQTGISAE